MTTTFGTIFAYLLKKLNDDEQADFTQILETYSKEICKSILLSKTWEEKWEAIQQYFKTVLDPEIIPVVKLLLKSQQNIKSKTLQIAYVIFGMHILNKINDVNDSIITWNKKLEELLKLSEAITIQPNDLYERGIWILNFNRMKHLMDHKLDKVTKYYKYYQSKQFNNYWYKMLKQKDQNNRTLLDMNKILMKKKLEVSNLKEVKDIIKEIRKDLNKNIYGYNYRHKRNNYLYILKRKIKLVNQMINKISEVKKLSEETLEEAYDIDNAVQLGKLKEVIDEIQKEDKQNLNDFTNNINNFQEELKYYTRVWEKLKLNPIQKQAEKLTLQFNYIINKIDNKGGTGELHTINEENEEMKDTMAESSYFNEESSYLNEEDDLLIGKGPPMSREFFNILKISEKKK
jgi:hypothetical protein